MYPDVYLHLPSSLFSSLKMLTLSFKFTITTQSCKMQFIFLQLGLVHESWFLLLQENCQLQEAQMQQGQNTQSKTNKKQTNQQQQTWPILWFILSSLRISLCPRVVPFSLRETWISRWAASVQLCSVLWLLLYFHELPPTLCSNCRWGLHLYSSQRSRALCSC